jgi:DNA-binding MarR family transcriptional regulator
MTTKTKTAPAKTKASANGTGHAPAATRPAALRTLALDHAALADPARLAILEHLAAAKAPATVADLAGRFGMTVEAATEAIAVLKQRNWLASERTPAGGGGGWRYSLNADGRKAAKRAFAG